MTKILLCGVIPENNFGGPSLLHGAREIINEIHEECEIVFYQSTNPVEIATKDLGFAVKKNPYRRVHDLLFDAIKYKYGKVPKSKDKQIFLRDIKQSTVVANLFGINFSSKFSTGKYSYFKAVKSTVGKYSINVAARILGVKSVKCTASYGPITSKTDITAAKLSAKRIFDVIVAREEESKKQLQRVTGKEVYVSPDIANMMSYNKRTKREMNRIGISVSFQIINQWKSEESYLDCIIKFIRHILKHNPQAQISLIPNEYMSDNPYSDIHVAQDIKAHFMTNENVEVLDVEKLTSTELKENIASCEVMVASRYHSCVASLSSGVPLLVVGWHYKYDELLKLYNQEKWIISSDDCSSAQLMNMFDLFWSEREDNKKIIDYSFQKIKCDLLRVGMQMFAQ